MDIWMEVGLEKFSYYLYDCEEVILEQLERNTARACRWAETLPDDDPFECVFIGEDIAFKTGPMVRVSWLERHYFPRLARVIDALHGRGLEVMFHSDGNLNAIMDGLVGAGIDLLNPIEVAAGMDLADLHRRYPDLIFAGGIDVSALLPFGTPEQIRDAVVKAIDDTDGQLLVGSSTEVFNGVPLENYLAMRDAAVAYRF
jgi:uroporphyrinogen decarboxylase